MNTYICRDKGSGIYALVTASSREKAAFIFAAGTGRGGILLTDKGIDVRLMEDNERSVIFEE